MKFIPDMDEVAKIPEPFRTNWAKALRSSKQHKGALINCEDLEAKCCLGVACELVGTPPEAMINRGVPTATEDGAIGVDLGGIEVAQMRLEGENPSYWGFTALNDYYLTHPQIADLLDGKTVEID
jgi:hypothetical protein